MFHQDDVSIRVDQNIARSETSMFLARPVQRGNAEAQLSRNFQSPVQAFRLLQLFGQCSAISCGSFPSNPHSWESVACRYGSKGTCQIIALWHTCASS
eukprot:Skav201192  [mRNA]  locus=scaffold633:279176:285953:+ [translate_table: standard]